MFKPMAQTVAFALLGAFILSLTYIPMMSTLFLSKKIKHTNNLSDRWMIKVERLYQHALGRVILIPRLTLSVVLSLFVVAVIVLSFLGGEFIPALEEGDFAVDTRVLTGSNITTTMESVQKAAHILKSRFPEVEKVVTKIGSGEVPTDPMPMEASDMMVILKDKKSWTSASTFDELAEKMGKALQEVPGITAGFQFPSIYLGQSKTGQPGANSGFVPRMHVGPVAHIGRDHHARVRNRFEQAALAVAKLRPEF